MLTRLLSLPFTAAPSPGWYKLCDSSEIELASTKHVALLNKDVALFRAAGDHESQFQRRETGNPGRTETVHRGHHAEHADSLCSLL